MTNEIYIAVVFFIVMFIVITADHLGFGKIEKYSLWLFVPCVIVEIYMFICSQILSEEIGMPLFTNKLAISTLGVSLYLVYAGALLFICGCIRTIWIKRDKLYTKC
jgi:hypothetical protein